MRRCKALLGRAPAPEVRSSVECGFAARAGALRRLLGGDGMRICEINGESNELGSSDQDRDDDDGGVGGARRCLGECFGVRFGVAAVGGERTPFACCCIIMSEYSRRRRGTCLLFHTYTVTGQVGVLTVQLGSGCVEPPTYVRSHCLVFFNAAIVRSVFSQTTGQIRFGAQASQCQWPTGRKLMYPGPPHLV